LNFFQRLFTPAREIAMPSIEADHLTELLEAAIAKETVTILQSTQNDVSFALTRLHQDNDRLEEEISYRITQLRDVRKSIQALEAANAVLNAPVLPPGQAAQPEQITQLDAE
jgi:hypothetical protein